MENNETHEECLKREVLEEMGMNIEIGLFVGCARRYFYSTTRINS
ncbi:NUDIX domain-containing protein [Fictibacillus gelatini]|nr:NUDIX domain-containing protein [Fictibacillus gelatini]